MHELLKKAGPVAGVVAVAVLLWWVYDLGKLHGATELESARASNAALERDNGRLAEEVAGLRKQVAILERSSQIDRRAADDVRADLEQLEEELQAAREQVAFYRGIVSPGDVKPGLRIHRFSLEAGAASGEYHYELVLTQLKRNDRSVNGVVDWKVSGRTPDGDGTLTLAEVTEPPVKQLKFRFRYFQDLAGTIRLPDGFEAEQVKLSVRPSGKSRQEPVVQVFAWPPPGT